MRSAAEQALFEKALLALSNENITFNKTLGLKVVSLLPNDVRIGFEMHPSLVGHYHYGRLHGGVISAALDATAGLGLMVALGEKHKSDSANQVIERFIKMGTIDLRVDFLRPGLGTRFEASAKVTRLGGRIASTQMALYNELGELIATGAAAYVIS
jgi:uncharacterized protein (TIGR00369 family)